MRHICMYKYYSKFPMVQKAYSKIRQIEETRYQARLDAAKESALETAR